MVLIAISACLLRFIAGCPERFSCPLFIGYGIAGNRVPNRIPCTSHLAVLPLPASAWNIPGHMLSAAITYQVLEQENPQIIEKVKAVLENHPWYANQWQARLQDVPVADRDMVLFMQAARWPDDIRTKDKAQRREQWHYINLRLNPLHKRRAL